MRYGRFPWILKGILFVGLFIFGFGYLTMALWNHLVPVLFSGPVITFWQAVGLLVLTRILFRGFGWRGHHGRCGCYGGEHGGHHGWKGGYWRKRWEEKLASMTPEEREKLRQKWADKCGGYGPPWMRKDEEQKEPPVSPS